MRSFTTHISSQRPVSSNVIDFREHSDCAVYLHILQKGEAVCESSSQGGGHKLLVQVVLITVGLVGASQYPSKGLSQSYPNLDAALLHTLYKLLSTRGTENTGRSGLLNRNSRVILLFFHLIHVLEGENWHCSLFPHSHNHVQGLSVHPCLPILMRLTADGCWLWLLGWLLTGMGPESLLRWKQ